MSEHQEVLRTVGALVERLVNRGPELLGKDE